MAIARTADDHGDVRELVFAVRRNFDVLMTYSMVAKITCPYHKPAIHSEYLPKHVFGARIRELQLRWRSPHFCIRPPLKSRLLLSISCLLDNKIITSMSLRQSLCVL